MRWQRIELVGADVRLGRFCAAGECQRWFDRLNTEIAWLRHRVKLFGREINAPRFSCWVGDAGTFYTYSRTRYAPRPWTPALRELRQSVSALCGSAYNSVLCNLYRDGRDAMGWHADDEAELGPEPVIASLSFGAPRVFRLRHRQERSRGVAIRLESGSLLVMAGATQTHYQHALPRDAACTAPRINLTFRHVRIAA
jgi:alkylated DNA repair dioxygenase AlkB